MTRLYKSASYKYIDMNWPYQVQTDTLTYFFATIYTNRPVCLYQNNKIKKSGRDILYCCVIRFSFSSVRAMAKKYKNKEVSEFNVEREQEHTRRTPHDIIIARKKKSKSVSMIKVARLFLFKFCLAINTLLND